MKDDIDERQIYLLVSAALQENPTTIAECDYKADLLDFSAWCRVQGLPPLPAAPTTVTAYLANLAVRCSLAIMQRRNASINLVHKEQGYELPGDKITIMQVIQSCKRHTAAHRARKVRPAAPLYTHQQKAFEEFRRSGTQILQVESGAGKVADIEIYVEQYQKYPGKVTNLEFCRTSDNAWGFAWRVYQYVKGRAKNWPCTNGRKWKTDIEAKEFLKQQGWKPI